MKEFISEIRISRIPRETAQVLSRISRSFRGAQFLILRVPCKSRSLPIYLSIHEYLHHRLRKPPCSLAQIPRCTLMLNEASVHRAFTPKSQHTRCRRNRSKYERVSRFLLFIRVSFLRDASENSVNTQIHLPLEDVVVVLFVFVFVVVVSQRHLCCLLRLVVFSVTITTWKSLSDSWTDQLEKVNPPFGVR